MNLGLNLNMCFDSVDNCCNVRKPMHSVQSNLDNHIHFDVDHKYNNRITESTQPSLTFVNFSEAFDNV